MSMNVMVTGGAGFIGSHVVDRLIQEGYQVSVIDNLSTGKKKNVNKKAKLYKVDIQSRGVGRALKAQRPTVIIHLAAQMNVRLSTEDPTFDASVNILGTINLLEHATQHGIRKVTFASSGGAAYGEQDVFPAPETHRTDPLSPYGISKLAGEKYLAYYSHETGIKYVALRFGNVYGPRQEPEGEAGVIAIFTRKMLKGEQPIINGTGKQTRDFVFVDDVVESVMATLQPDVQGIYNVGTGEETTVNECYTLLKEFTKADCKDLYGPAKKGEQVRSVLDIRKIRETFGWEPHVSLKDGLSQTVDFFKA